MKNILLLLALLLSPSAKAIYLSSGVFTLESDKSQFSRQFLNNTDSTNLYTIAAFRIDRPGIDERQQPLQNGEILYTPLKKVLEPGAWEFFKIFYKGPEDDRERYYRIIIKETPTNATPIPAPSKSPLVSPVVALDTVLVVRPRKMNFSYDYNPNMGVLTNTGNTYFRVILHKTCEENDDTAKIFQLLPGERYRGEEMKGQHSKFIVAFDKYIRVGNQCAAGPEN
ncbi:fimbrial protein [Enterobacter sp. Ap-1006]|uniref:fimbrial protein n=1 Tax=Enterobacter sp. Ap-1006 TaxID=2608345 RepID=UPI0014220AE6|nr:fimbrial protein [Enterobacter sp. Ap-1006]NIF48662.1 fimbrial protein [Enterobacter sp. Ap-1006]